MVPPSRHAPPFVCAVALATALVFGSATLASGQGPATDIAVDPTLPIAGEPATYSITPVPDPVPTTVEWDFDEDGTTDAEGVSVSHKFATAGDHTVSAVVAGGAPLTKVVAVNARPVADFNFRPSTADIDEPVLFVSTSTDPDDHTTTNPCECSYSWDFGDGTAPSGGLDVEHPFAMPGVYTVTLTVTDVDGTSDTASEAVTVVDSPPPVPGFVWSPTSPVANQEVELVSTSVDPAGGPLTVVWDLNDDGTPDATGSSVMARFSAGEHVISIKATDDQGQVGTLSRVISVGPAPAAPSAPTQPAEPVLPAGPIEPSANATPIVQVPAVVRLAGKVLATGARITALQVRGPAGARVTVLCRGKGCPFPSRRKRITKSSVRFRGIQGRFLRGGVKIGVYVRATDFIGKYTSWVIRKGKPPKRTDLCLLPGSSKPARCPPR